MLSRVEVVRANDTIREPTPDSEPGANPRAPLSPLPHLASQTLFLCSQLHQRSEDPEHHRLNLLRLRYLSAGPSPRPSVVFWPLVAVAEGLDRPLLLRLRLANRSWARFLTLSSGGDSWVGR